jgi:hypothetical protein
MVSPKFSKKLHLAPSQDFTPLFGTDDFFVRLISSFRGIHSYSQGALQHNCQIYIIVLSTALL